MRRGAFGTAKYSLLTAICLLIAAGLAQSQNRPAERTPLAAESTSENAATFKTERQRWTALRDAKRFSDKAEAYEKQGRIDEAERMAEKALALEEQARGPWHIDVAHRLDQVADLYTTHKKEGAAEPLYERAKAIRERALNAHPDVYEKDNGELRLKRNQPAEKAVQN